METLTPFNVPSVPSGLAALAQRRAVLEPLAGPVETDEQVVAATLHVAELWRARVTALARAGLPGLADPRPKGGRSVGRKALVKAAERRARALACPPPFVDVGPRGRACGLFAVCPFCWSRLVAGHWRSVDKAFFQPAEHRKWEQARKAYKEPKDRFWHETMARAGVTSFPPPVRPPGPGRLPRSDRFDLVAWEGSSSAPFRPADPRPGLADVPLHRLMNAVVDEQLRLDLYIQRGLWGALDAPTVTYRGEVWYAGLTRLAMVVEESGSAVAASWAATLNDGAVRLVPRPTRDEVFDAVVRACRYPPELLTGADPAPVVALVEARRGRRVVATYGWFGGRGRSVVG